MLKIIKKFIKLPYVFLIIRKVTNVTGNVPYELWLTLGYCLFVNEQLYMEMCS